jgi:hypothetical protein
MGAFLGDGVYLHMSALGCDLTAMAGGNLICDSRTDGISQFGGVSENGDGAQSAVGDGLGASTKLRCGATRTAQSRAVAYGVAGDGPCVAGFCRVAGLPVVHAYLGLDAASRCRCG